MEAGASFVGPKLAAPAARSRALIPGPRISDIYRTSCLRRPPFKIPPTHLSLSRERHAQAKPLMLTIHDTRCPASTNDYLHHLSLVLSHTNAWEDFRPNSGSRPLSGETRIYHHAQVLIYAHQYMMHAQPVPCIAAANLTVFWLIFDRLADQIWRYGYVWYGVYNIRHTADAWSSLSCGFDVPTHIGSLVRFNIIYAHHLLHSGECFMNQMNQIYMQITLQPETCQASYIVCTMKYKWRCISIIH